MIPTEMKRKDNFAQQEDMAVSSEIWRHIFDAIEDPAFVHDAQFRVLSANLAYCHEAGVSEVDILGKPYWEVFPLGTGPLPGCNDSISGKVDGGSQEEVRVGERLFLSRSYTARDGQGQPLYAMHILRDITAQKNTETDRAESDERFRLTIESARDAIINIDGESGAVIAWNPAAEGMFGYSQDEAAGRVLHEIITPLRFRETAMKTMVHSATAEDGAATGKTLEMVGLHKNGTEFPIELSLSTTNTRGKWFTICIVRNILERKQGEAALLKSKNLLQSIVENVPGGVFWKDRDLRYLGCNTQFARNSGHTRPSELVGKTDFEMGWKDMAEIYRANDMEVLKSGTPMLDYEEPMRAAAGKTLSVSTSKVPLRDESGEVVAVLGIYKDITERKHAEELLKNMAAKFHTLYESSPDAIMLLDEKGFFDCNEATLRMFGCTSHNEFIGKQPAQFSPPNQPGGVDSMSLANERIATAFKDGSILFEWVHRRTDGTDFPAEVLLTALELAGKPALQATVRDITERKQAEEKNLSLSRMYRTISRADKALVGAWDEVELANAMCRILVEEGHFLGAWVGYIEQGVDKRVRPVAAAGMEMEFIESLNPTWADEGYGRGPAGTAIRAGQVVVCHSVSEDVMCMTEQEMARQLGYSTVVAIPVRANQHNSAVMVVYGSHTNELSEDIVSLLTELAGDLGFGINNLRSRSERIGILEKLEVSLDQAVTAIASTVEMRDPYTAGHQRRVAELATAIATEMGLPHDQIKGLHMACVVHDIGKIHVPAEILSSPAKLSDAEYAILKTHPQAGWEILKGIDFPWPVAEVVYQHHERLDGSGYPRGLRGDEILLEARILSVADVVEAMTSHRPYRPGLGVLAGLQEISDHKGELYDVAVVEACERVFKEQGFEWSATTSTM